MGKDFVIKCDESVFTDDEISMLKKDGDFCLELETGDREPDSYGQREFVKAAKGIIPPQNKYQKLWFKYKRRLYWEKSYGWEKKSRLDWEKHYNDQLRLTRNKKDQVKIFGKTFGHQKELMKFGLYWNPEEKSWRGFVRDESIKTILAQYCEKHKISYEIPGREEIEFLGTSNYIPPDIIMGGLVMGEGRQFQNSLEQPIVQKKRRRRDG